MPRLAKTSRHDEAPLNTRSYQSTITGAVTITSLVPMPSAQQVTEAAYHQAGFGATPIQGFIRGNHVEFQVPYGAKTLYFDGRRNASQLDGTFSATPSGERGTWTTVTN